MVDLSIILDGDGAWPDMRNFVAADIAAVAILDKGMTSGLPSVAVRINIGDQVIVAQTSARLFCSAAKAFMAKYPNLFED